MRVGLLHRTLSYRQHQKLYPFTLPSSALQVGEGDEEEAGPVDELGAPGPVEGELQALYDYVAVDEVSKDTGDLDGEVDKGIACAYHSVEEHCGERHDHACQDYDA